MSRRVGTVVHSLLLRAEEWRARCSCDCRGCGLELLLLLLQQGKLLLELALLHLQLLKSMLICVLVAVEGNMSDRTVVRGRRLRQRRGKQGNRMKLGSAHLLGRIRTFSKPSIISPRASISNCIGLMRSILISGWISPLGPK